MKAVVVLIWLAVAMTQAPVFGATLLSMGRELDQTSPSGGGFTLTIDGSLLRIDSQTGEEPSLIIFESAQRQLLLIDRERKTYTVIDGTRVERVAEQMKPEYSKLPEEEVPPGLRESDKSNELRETSDIRNVNGYSCRITETYRDGEKVREFCVAEWNAISSGTAIAQTLAALSDFARDLADAFLLRIPMGGSLDNPFAEVPDLGGFPVLATGYQNGEAVWSSALLSAETVSISPTIFEAPAGYKRQDPPPRSR